MNKSKQLRMAEELDYLVHNINENIKSINVARKRLMEGSQTEYGYAREKVESIETTAKFVKGRLRKIQEDKEAIA